MTSVIVTRVYQNREQRKLLVISRILNKLIQIQRLGKLVSEIIGIIYELNLGHYIVWLYKGKSLGSVKDPKISKIDINLLKV